MSSFDKRKGKTVKNERTSVRMQYSLDYLFEYFYQAKVAEGRAKSTLESYIMNYKGFCEYLEIRELERDIRNVTAELGREYVTWLRTEKRRFGAAHNVPEYAKTVGLLPKSINTRLKVMKTMFTFLEDNEKIERNPFAKVKCVEDLGSDITILEPDDVKSLLDAPNLRKYSDFRDYVILNLLVDGMLRIEEALTIRKKDIDFSSGSISLRKEIVKTRKARIVPITKSTAKLLQELIRETEEFDSEYVFLSNYGERLTPNNFRQRLKKYAKRANIDKNVFPHLMRHTGATYFLESGGSQRHLQIILGHADGRMTAHYTHLSDKSIKKNHDEHSPLNTVLSNSNKSRKILR